MGQLTVVVSPPWQGHCPDSNPITADISMFLDCRGLMPYHGVLTIDAGFEKYEDEAAATLPLGGSNIGPTAPSSGTPLTNTTIALAQPVIGFGEIIRRDVGTDRNWLYCITGVSALTAGTESPVGFVWAYSPLTDAWENVPWNDADTSGTEIAADRDQLYDTAFYPFGGTGISGGDRPGMLVICDTTKGDEVYVVDPGANLLVPPSGLQPPGEYDTWGQINAATFKATSVEVLDGRVCFLNTDEDSGSEKNRVRFSAVRLTDPTDFTAPGAGSIDWGDFTGDGLRILRLADVGVCYFTDGVGFLRRNFQQNRPFLLQYLTTTRGLLSTFAVCKINEDIHFGLFTDGWYYLKSDGSFTEAGNRQGTQENRWFDTFYGSLDRDNIHRLTISYDRYFHRVRVAWPNKVSGLQDIWVYDIDTDSVWPDQIYEVTQWGITDPVLEIGDTWSSAAGQWIEYGGSWLDAGPTFGDRTVIHGDSNGYTFIRNNGVTTQALPTLVEPLVQDIAWSITTHKPEFGDPQTMVVSGQTRILHRGMTSSPGVSFTLGVSTEDGVSYTETLNMGTDNLPDVGVPISQYTNHHVSSPRLGLVISGVGPPHIYSLQLTLMPETGLQLKNL